MVLHSMRACARHPLARTSDDAVAAIQRAFQRTFDDSWARPAAMPVRLDVKEDESAFHITADLPGLTEKEVDVTFDDGVLTIRGEKKITRDEKKDTWHITERSHGSFARQISMPANVDAAKIEAKFEKGVLQVDMPKTPPEEPKATKINIKPGT